MLISKVALICFFCANKKDNEVEISKGALMIGCVKYTMRFFMLKVQLISKFNGITI
jgi:hypothetical protein